MSEHNKELQGEELRESRFGYPRDFAREYMMEMRYNQMTPRQAFRKTAKSSWISEESREWAKARPEMEELLSEISDDELIKRINALTRALEKSIRFGEREDSMSTRSIREGIERLMTELDLRTQPVV